MSIEKTKSVIYYNKPDIAEFVLTNDPKKHLKHETRKQKKKGKSSTIDSVFIVYFSDEFGPLFLPNPTTEKKKKIKKK